MPSLARKALSHYREGGVRRVLQKGLQKTARGVRKSSERSKETRLRLELWRRTRHLPNQSSKLTDLRSSDDWLLIILDACRFDVFEEEFSDYLDGDLQPIKSVGRNTFEYVRLCWPDYHEVTYISGIAPVNSYLPDDFDTSHWGYDPYEGYVPDEHISEIVDVWDFDWDEPAKAPPPELVTDVANNHASLPKVVHYHQPHAPYLGSGEGMYHADKTVADLAADPRVSDTEIREIYTANLRRALTDLPRLIERTDAEKVVVTADHGEALGEWGVYAHTDTPHPYTRIVPWLEVKDVTLPGKRVTPSRYDRPIEKGSVKGQLEDLGYL